jgi:sulfate adenylyltransferase subunit 2
MNALVENNNVHVNARHLDALESEAIHILREVAAECSNPALLFSGGKDSVVLLRLAEKAFRPGKFPFPLVHVDTGHNFAEVITFRDKRVAELGERLIVGSVEDSIKKGTVRSRSTDSPGRAARCTARRCRGCSSRRLPPTNRPAD